MTPKPEPEVADSAPVEYDDSSERTIHQRMIAILAEMPAIGKTQRNTEQNFMFRGHDDVLNALNPLLAKHGVLIVPEVLERLGAHRTTSRGSTMYEVNLRVRFTFWGAKGDQVVAATWGEGTDMGDKATNKAMTMAFKNVLIQAFSISSAEFQDTDAGTPEETSAAGASQGKTQDAKMASAAEIEKFLADLEAGMGKETRDSWESSTLESERKKWKGEVSAAFLARARKDLDEAIAKAQPAVADRVADGAAEAAAEGTITGPPAT